MGGQNDHLRLLLGCNGHGGPCAGLGRDCLRQCCRIRRLIGYLPTTLNCPATCGRGVLDLSAALRAAPRSPQARIASLIRAWGCSGRLAADQDFLHRMATRLGIAVLWWAIRPCLLGRATAGLDPAARRFTLDLIRDWARRERWLWPLTPWVTSTRFAAPWW